MRDAAIIYKKMQDTAFPDGVDETKVDAAVQFIEAQSRLAALLMQAELNRIGAAEQKLPKQSGLGSYRNFLRAALSPKGGATEPIQKMAREVYDMPAVQTTELARGIETYRNYLLHGGIVPPRAEVANEIVKIVESNADGLMGYLCSVKYEAGAWITDDCQEIMLDGELSLSPLIYQQGDHIIYLREASKRRAIYVSTDPCQPEVTIEYGGSKTARILLENLVQTGPGELGRQMRYLESKLRQDIQAFEEPGTEPKWDFWGDEVSVEWTLNAENPTTRRDIFYIGKSGGIRWHNPISKESLDYNEFIKTLANWQTVVYRVAEDLRSLRHGFDMYSQEDLFESQAFAVPEEIGTTYLFLQGGDGREVGRDILMEQIDQTAQRALSESRIFFLKGEAGIGKTHNLIDICELRAEECVGGGVKPLYIYVDCAKTSLLDLKDLITARVSFTRNLDYNRVAALCRNGLAAVVIDSFDELLGGVGYRRASELLDPFIRLLNNNGSIVLTARSSYYSNQYKSDLERGGTDIANARHVEVELMRWSRRDVPEILERNNIPVGEIASLSANDLDLLTLPFFCRVFVSALPDARAGGSLRELLVGQYISREQRKLSSDKGEADVDRAELGSDTLVSIFMNVASYMHELQESELPESEYLLACALALNLELDSPRHRYLRDRLQNLCGLEAGSSEKSIMFGFSHDLYYETFLGKRLVAELGSGRDGVDALFEYGEVGDAAMASFSQGSEIDKIRDYLQYASSVNAFSAVGRGNLAAAISEYVKRDDANGLARFSDLDFAELDLRNHRTGQLIIERCRIGRLILSVDSLEEVRVLNSFVDRLEVEGIDSGDLSSLYLDDSSVPSTLILLARDSRQSESSVKEFLESYRALEKLKSLHCRGTYVSLVDSVDLESDENMRFAVAVLGKLEARHSNRFLVLRDTLAPAESTDAWLQKLGTDSQWRMFVNALLDSGCANQVSITTSGAPKVRIKLGIDPRSLLRERLVGKTPRFWSEISGG